MNRHPRPTDTEDHRELPVSLLDVKEQAKIEHDEEDRHVLMAAMAATAEAEKYLGTPIMAQSYDLVLDGFPADGIEMVHSPVRSVTSITYYDADGVSQTLAEAAYYLLTNGPFPTIELSPGQAWPETQVRKNAVTVRYVAGYAVKASAVPPNISYAITLRAATRLANREEAGVGTVAWKLSDRLAFEALLNPYRIINV